MFVTRLEGGPKKVNHAAVVRNDRSGFVFDQIFLEWRKLSVLLATSVRHLEGRFGRVCLPSSQTENRADYCIFFR